MDKLLESRDYKVENKKFFFDLKENVKGRYLRITESSGGRSAIVVPEDAVLPLQGANFVWVAKDGKATRRQVELGVRRPGWVEAKSGIDRGDLVVVGGQERLSEGAPVAPKPVERAPAARQEG